MARLEGQRGGRSLTLRDIIDRPPQETREQWLARHAGDPDRTLINGDGETRKQWIARRELELSAA